MPQLPAGLVTFLFTDIEGSTRLHQRLGPAYADLLASHDRLLNDVTRAHGGVVVKSMGDGVFAAFQEVPQSVAAAGAMQRAVTGHSWPADVDLRIRIGLHCGCAEPRDDDYVALAVHQAARVAAAAYGGQVLATRDVVERAAEPGCGGWDGLGRYRLRGFDDPAHLYQLLVDGGPARRFDGTRATPAAAHNVPEVHTSFVGREAELRVLTSLLQSGRRLVTVLGPGGVGKTRLGFELVKRIADSYPDGAWVVLLANASTEPDLIDHLLRTLHIPEQKDVSPRQTLLAVLRERRTLLLFDNTE